MEDINYYRSSPVAGGRNYQQLVEHYPRYIQGAEKRRKLEMEKLFQLEERKKSATNVEARRAAMAEKEKKMITLTEQPGLLPFVTYKPRKFGNFKC